jgi:emp24/gp25L/p24 family/GOLD
VVLTKCLDVGARGLNRARKVHGPRLKIPTGKSRTWPGIKERSSHDQLYLLFTPRELTTIYYLDCATMRSIIPLLSLSALLAPVQSLYFYIDGTSPKCFFEELPKDTLVVGHYTAEEYNDITKMWSKHDGLNVFISVDVCFPSSSVPWPL